MGWINKLWIDKNEWTTAMYSNTDESHMKNDE